jgi:hypothetical protein
MTVNGENGGFNRPRKNNDFVGYIRECDAVEKNMQELYQNILNIAIHNIPELIEQRKKQSRLSRLEYLACKYKLDLTQKIQRQKFPDFTDDTLIHVLPVLQDALRKLIEKEKQLEIEVLVDRLLLVAKDVTQLTQKKWKIKSLAMRNTNEYLKYVQFNQLYENIVNVHCLEIDLLTLQKMNFYINGEITIFTEYNELIDWLETDEAEMYSGLRAVITEKLLVAIRIDDKFLALGLDNYPAISVFINQLESSKIAGKSIDCRDIFNTGSKNIELKQELLELGRDIRYPLLSINQKENGTISYIPTVFLAPVIQQLIKSKNVRREKEMGTQG